MLKIIYNKYNDFKYKISSADLYLQKTKVGTLKRYYYTLYIYIIDIIFINISIF